MVKRKPLTFSGHVIAVANGDVPRAAFKQALASMPPVVAIDGGLIFCDKMDIVPALIAGDLDSAPQKLLKKYSHVTQLHLPDQNKNDLEKTLEYLFSFPVETVTVLGALGKRLDHTLANLSLLFRYPEKVIFASAHEICFALKERSTINCAIGQTLSLMPFGAVTGVRTSGLKWEIKNAVFSEDFFSLSNIALQKKVSISFKNGRLLLMLSKKKNGK